MIDKPNPLMYMNRFNIFQVTKYVSSSSRKHNTRARSLAHFKFIADCYGRPTILKELFSTIIQSNKAPSLMKRTVIALSLLLLSTPKAFCEVSVNASNMGLGRAGSTTGILGFKAYLNPAKTHANLQGFSFTSYAGGQFLDHDRLLDTFEEAESYYESLQMESKLKKINRGLKNGEIKSEQFRDLASSANQVVEQVELLADKYLRAGAGYGAQIAYQHSNFTTAFYSRRHQSLNGVAQNSPEDIQAINRLSSLAYALADTYDTAKVMDDYAHNIEWPLIEDLIKESVDMSQLASIEPIPNLSIGSLSEIPNALDQIKRIEDQVAEMDWPKLEDVIKESVTNSGISTELDRVRPDILRGANNLLHVRQTLKDVEALINRIDWRELENELLGIIEQAEQTEQVARSIAQLDYSRNEPHTALQQIEQNIADIEEAIKSIDVSKDIDALAQSVKYQEILKGLRLFRLKANVQALDSASDTFEQQIKELKQHIDLDKLIGHLVRQNMISSANGLNLKNTNLRNFMLYPIPDQLNSIVIFTGSDIKETGVNFSYSDQSWNGLTVGINIKRMVYATVAYIQLIREVDFDHYFAPASRKEYQFWNADLGLTYQVNGHWTIGGTVRNVFSKTLTDQLDNKVYLKPLSTIGIAYRDQRLILALDADLTQSENINAQSEQQFLSIGGEIAMPFNTGLRAGYRYNLATDFGLPSIGISWRGKHFTLDVAASYSEEQLAAEFGTELGILF